MGLRRQDSQRESLGGNHAKLIKLMQGMKNNYSFNFLFKISDPIGKKKTTEVTHTQVNKCHLAEFCNLASSITIELYLKANGCFILISKRGFEVG